MVRVCRQHGGTERRSWLDIVVILIEVAIVLAAIVGVAIGMAFVFIIVLSLATGLDSNIQQEDERA